MKKFRILPLFLALMLMGATACGLPDKEQSGSSNADSDTESVVGSNTDSDTESDVDTDTDSNTDTDKETDVYYTVEFNTDGAGEIAAQTVLEGENITKPENPNKTTSGCEYTFLGWYFGEDKWDFENDVVTQNMTLVAHWEEGNKYSPPYLPKD